MQTSPAQSGAGTAALALPTSADAQASAEGFASSLAAALFAVTPQTSPQILPQAQTPAQPGDAEAALAAKAAQVQATFAGIRGGPARRDASPLISPEASATPELNPNAKPVAADVRLGVATVLKAVSPGDVVAAPKVPAQTTTALTRPDAVASAVNGSAPVGSDLVANGEILAVRARQVDRAEAMVMKTPAAEQVPTSALAGAQGAGASIAAKAAVRRDAAEAAPTAGRPSKPTFIATQKAVVGGGLAPVEAEPALALELDDAADRPLASDTGADHAQEQASGPSTEVRTPVAAHVQPTVLHSALRVAPQTVAALTSDIAKKLEARHSRFEVALDPAGLGRVEVRVEVGPAGAMAASLNFDNPQAAEALKSRAHELHAALEQAGFDLSGGLSFTSNGADREAQRERPAFAERAVDGLRIADLADQTAAPAPGRSRSSRAGGLDIRI